MGCKQGFIFFFKNTEKKNGKKPKKKTDDNRTRDDRVRLSGAYDYMKAARGVVSFSRRRRRRRPPPPPCHHHRRSIVCSAGGKGETLTHTGTGGAVRGGLTGGGTNRNTPRVRVRAGDPRRERRALFAGISVGGDDDFPLRPRRTCARIRICKTFESPPNPSHDRPSRVVHPAALVTFRAGTDFCLHLLSPRKDTPSSLNRTSVWQRSFLRFPSTLFSFFIFYFYLYARHFLFF